MKELADIALAQLAQFNAQHPAPITPRDTQGNSPQPPSFSGGGVDFGQVGGANVGGFGGGADFGQVPGSGWPSNNMEFTEEDAELVEGELEDELDPFAAGDVTMQPYALREKRFMDEVKLYAPLYAPGLADAFAAYWTEPNPGRTHMRFEIQEIFEIPRRLKAWERKEANFTRGRSNDYTPGLDWHG